MIGQWAFLSGRLAHVWVAHKPEDDRITALMLKLCGNGTAKRFEVDRALATPLGEKCGYCERAVQRKGVLIMNLSALEPIADLQLAWP